MPHCHDYSKYKKRIYIEINNIELDEKELNDFAGICIDFTHLEDTRLCDPKVHLIAIELENRLAEQLEVEKYLRFVKMKRGKKGGEENANQGAKKRRSFGRS